MKMGRVEEAIGTEARKKERRARMVREEESYEGNIQEVKKRREGETGVNGKERGN